MMPGGGGTQFLPRAAGERRAKELIFTAAPFTPKRRSRGASSIDVRAGDAERSGRDRHTIAENAPLSTRQAKKAIRYGLSIWTSTTALRFEIEA